MSPSRQQPQHPDPRLAPWPGFALAAAAAVERLSALIDLDLWMVTAVQGDRQVVVASAGPWSSLVGAGTVFPYDQSFCLRMIDRQGPTAAPDVLLVPAYAEAARGLLARVRSYIGVPLEGEDGQLFGTLCAVAGDPRGPGLTETLEIVELVGQMLSTILAREQFALARSQEATAAQARADHDPLTGLRNLRGWQGALRQEHERCQRHGSTPSVVSLGLCGDVEPDADSLVRGAEALRCTGRPGDVLARLSGGEFAVLAVACNPLAARALATRLRVRLRSAGLTGTVGTATRRTGEDLDGTWRRAQSARGRDGVRRRPAAVRGVRR